MICRYCNGTGTSNTCVNGTFKPCAACNGTGEEREEKITNFDRITASPEALAEFLDELSNACITCGEKDYGYYHNEDCPFGDFGNCADKYRMLKWLNEESKQ